MPSESVCYPAKLVHGHIQSLINKGVKTIFYPSVFYERLEDKNAGHHFNCPVVASYPETIKNNVEELDQVNYIQPYLSMNKKETMANVLTEALSSYQISKKEIEKAIENLHELDVNFKKAKEEYESKKASLTGKIQNFMAVKKIDFLDFKSKSEKWKNINFNVKNICPKKIIFDADKLEKKLSKEICSKIIKKEYKINDIKALSDFLKGYGVDPKEFKEFLTIEKTVDNKKLDNLSDIGEITEDDIKGCYVVKPISSYIKISEVEDAEDRDR